MYTIDTIHAPVKKACRSLDALSVTIETKVGTVFTVGLATPEITDYSDILAKSLTAECLAKTKVFHLHGGIDYGQLSMVHKAMMAFKKKEAEKMPLDERTSDDYALLETYGKKCDFTNREAIKPLIDYVRTL